jgi:hypothetical protein
MIYNIIIVSLLILSILGMLYFILPILSAYIFCMSVMVLLFRAIQKKDGIL